jgi:hypothetical protein
VNSIKISLYIDPVVWEEFKTFVSENEWGKIITDLIVAEEGRRRKRIDELARDFDMVDKGAMLESDAYEEEAQDPRFVTDYDAEFVMEESTSGERISPGSRRTKAGSNIYESQQDYFYEINILVDHRIWQEFTSLVADGEESGVVTSLLHKEIQRRKRQREIEVMTEEINVNEGS